MDHEMSADGMGSAVAELPKSPSHDGMVVARRCACARPRSNRQRPWNSELRPSGMRIASDEVLGLGFRSCASSDDVQKPNGEVGRAFDTGERDDASALDVASATMPRL